MTYITTLIVIAIAIFKAELNIEEWPFATTVAFLQARIPIILFVRALSVTR